MKHVVALRWVWRSTLIDEATCRKEIVLQQRVGDTDFPFDDPADWEDVPLVEHKEAGR